MLRFSVAGWPAESGWPYLTEDTRPVAATVDPHAETVDWEARTCHPPTNGPPTVTFVDGTRRREATFTITADDGRAAVGLIAAWAVGAVVWDRHAGRTRLVGEPTTGRVQAHGPGVGHIPPLIDGVDTVPVENGHDPDRLDEAVHKLMQRHEQQLAQRLAAQHTTRLVLVDGPSGGRIRGKVVGIAKTHHRRYLEAGEHVDVVSTLGPGQRTPLFRVMYQQRNRAVLSWYTRVAPGVHPWEGTVRCDTADRPLADAIRLADTVTGLLPVLASPAHFDPRAPQNLVPIVGLERLLKNRLGDPRIVARRLADSIAEQNRKEQP